jgi:catechol 2,3-dioxygenase-like lactoylglutathione lyase family enzyme
MRSGIDHLMINANDYDQAVRFYGWLMPKIGYPHFESFSDPSQMTGYYGDSGSLWVVVSDPAHGNDTFDKGRWVCARSRFAPRAASKLTNSPAASHHMVDASWIRRGNTIIAQATIRSFSPIPMV